MLPIDGPDIFATESFATYLVDLMNHKRKTQSQFSYAVLARGLGGVSTSLVTQIGQGKRFPSESLLLKFKSHLKWNNKEFEFARALVGLARSKSNSEKVLYTATLKKLKPKNKALFKTLDEFDFFAQWYNVVIFAMAARKDFEFDPKWIAFQLGGDVSTAEAKESLALLQRLGLLKAPGVTQDDAHHYQTPNNFPSQAVRMFHGTMLKKAAHALRNQSIEERFFSGTSMSVRMDRIKDAQDYLLDVRQKFIEEFSTLEADSVYHFSLQFFRVGI